MSWFQEEGKFSENISLIDSQLLGSPQGMCCYLIQGGKKTALIDVSGPQEAERIISKLKSEKISPDIVILTHSHWDHASGVPLFQKAYPDIEIMVGETGIKALKNNKKFNEPFTNFEMLPNLESIEGLTSVKDGDVIDLGGLNLSIMETPGHSDCSISIYEPDQKILFTGDALGNLWTLDFIMPPAMPPEFSEERFFKTLDKVKEINYSSLGFMHFGILTGMYAKKFPDKAKAAYIDWRDFFISVWKENPDEKYVAGKFKERLNNFGYDDNKQFIKFEIYGAWMLKGLKSSNIIS